MANESRWIGIDIGGANLKFAINGQTESVPFPLWKQPDRLAFKLREVLSHQSDFVGLAITMTGELADCFTSRQQGVQFICEAVESISNHYQTRYYQTTGRFVAADQAISDWQLTAASNWHATANLISRQHANCILIDIGSTTTDIIPVVGGTVAAIGKTDYQRLVNHELVYSGVGRTAASALIQHVTIDSDRVPVAAEYFSTTKDAYLVLGRIKEQMDDCQTADGRPANIAGATRRLTKMVCLDADEVPFSAVVGIAEQIAQAQYEALATAIKAVAQRVKCEHFIAVGEGDWLAADLVSRIYPNAKLEMPGNLAHAAPAHAVAQLIDNIDTTG